MFTLAATGVQIYTCEYDANHGLDWKFKAPSALLYDDNGADVVAHSVGPTWAANDGSRIVCQAIAQIPSEYPGSVPQLLLRTSSQGSSGVLAKVR